MDASAAIWNATLRTQQFDEEIQEIISRRGLSGVIRDKVLIKINTPVWVQFSQDVSPESGPGRVSQGGRAQGDQAKKTEGSHYYDGKSRRNRRKETCGTPPPGLPLLHISPAPSVIAAYSLSFRCRACAPDPGRHDE